ncbi:MAG: hypothetical protein ABI210_12240 [Abditibacteriaceae bacterium]
MSPGIIGLLFKDVDAADKTAKVDAPAQARLEQIKQYLIFEYFNCLNAAEPNATKRAAHAPQINAFEYRTP